MYKWRKNVDFATPLQKLFDDYDILGVAVSAELACKLSKLLFESYFSRTPGKCEKAWIALQRLVADNFDKKI